LEYSKKEGDILADIVRSVRESLAERKKLAPLDSLRNGAAGTERRDFLKFITGGGVSVIAEMKKASPSAGILRKEYDPAGIAKGYEEAGATALSVLTEERHFGGSLSDLIAVKAAVSLPVLRKDFIVDEYQIFESAAAGADAILLIARILNEDELGRFLSISAELGLSALVEAHTEGDIRRAIGAGARIIGVNNRDLATLKTSIERSIELKSMIPADRIAVSESGIRGREEIEALGRAGFQAVLIGEALLKNEDPGRALAELLAGKGKLS